MGDDCPGSGIKCVYLCGGSLTLCITNWPDYDPPSPPLTCCQLCMDLLKEPSRTSTRCCSSAALARVEEHAWRLLSFLLLIFSEWLGWRSVCKRRASYTRGPFRRSVFRIPTTPSNANASFSNHDCFLWLLSALSFCFLSLIICSRWQCSKL